MNSDNNTGLPTNYEFLEINQSKSWFVNLNFLEQNFNLIKNHFGLVTGLGFQWNNYRFDDDIVIRPDSNIIYGYKNTDDVSYNKSKLLISYLTAPVILEYQTNNKKKSNSFHIGAGVIFGLRIGSHTKRVYKDGDEKQKPKSYDDFHLNPFTVNATARIGWGKIDLFANYSLSQMFKDNEGPEVYPFSIGISFSG